MRQFKFENITVKYITKPYEYFNDKWNEFHSVGNMKLIGGEGDFDWLEDDKYLDHLSEDIATDSTFDIINLFEKLLQDYCENEYTLMIECIHPMWIYHDLLHANEGDLFPGNSEYIKQVEPWRIQQQFEWCIDNNIQVTKKHLNLMMSEDPTTIKLITEYSAKLKEIKK